jgi:hypothetical protein
MKIKYLIDTILSPKLTALSFVDRYASIVRTINIAETVSGIVKRYPVSCDVSAVDCVNTGLYQDLVPNDTKTSVVYWEMIQPMSNIGYTRTNDFYQKRFRGTARLVVWLNLAKLGIDNCTSSLELIPIIEKELTTKGKIIGGIYDGNLLWIQPRSMVKQDINIVFGGYDYNKLKNYYLYPFDFFAIDVEFTMEQCLSKGGEFPTLPAIDCENKIPETNLCRSIDLDGVNEYISYGLFPTPFAGNELFNFQINERFSISAWFKIGTQPFQTIVSKYDYSIFKGYGFEINSQIGGIKKLRFFISDALGGGSIVVRSTQTIIPDVWYNVIVTYNGSGSYLGQNIYINSINDTSVETAGSPTDIQVSNHPLEIGRISQPSRYVDGLIANVRIWNTDLSASDVVNEYNGGVINTSPVAVSSLLLDTDIPNANFLTADPTYGTGYLINNKIDNNKLFTYNSEIEDLIEECPE